MNQDFPLEHFDVFLNTARLRAWKFHDELEKRLALRFGLRNCNRSETLKISPYSIFFFDSKSSSNELF